MSKRTILITGCDSGFGLSLALDLQTDKTLNLILTCLQDDGFAAHHFSKLPNVVVKIVNFLKADQVDDLIAFVNENNPDGLYGLVNNAGLAYGCEIYPTSSGRIADIFRVNFMVPALLIDGLLHLIIKHGEGDEGGGDRGGGGRIVNVCSTAGRIGAVGYGVYGASKAALIHYSAVLATELRRFKVTVSTIEPTAFKTANYDREIVNKRKEEIYALLTHDKKAFYDKMYVDKMCEKLFENANRMAETDLKLVTDKIRMALFDQQPSECYPVGRGARMISIVYSLMPVRLQAVLRNVLATNK